ncbi:preprotein translocase subunit SecE [Brachybacterium halotolerans subsp. kimchii]|uniref:Protein translocase subunit SecE n=2 Tax=Brachybacterium TaxID=43668 RepID=A0ABS1B9C6_9MICO|nr:MULTISPECIES: preprotein translocase subunit SecE [Brachybacterium]MBK0331251.1 preprotein translocase subunit SecE [Brachybacterium halotolerans]MCG7310964.1 preprotein translocase subunit SecE [Brachybacterium sp. ACRRE]UEJ82285.1 preprotein translocase subunit SecE [Brachybacterium halotolerans subsp. kimchii]UQN29765.1 preprotein translocase subunit SecE [Brachybacterium kimchii]
MSSSHTSPATPHEGRRKDDGSRNPFVAIGLFVRQVIAELKKVVIPTRKELAVYAVTVLMFVFVMILLVFGLDFVFGWLSRITFVVPDSGL